MIDKTTAGILYSYGYKLKDSEGNVWLIKELLTAQRMGIKREGHKISQERHNRTIGFEEIGTTYKILARDLKQLTQEIEGKVPLIECARIAMPDKSDFSIIHEEGGFLDDGWLTTFYYENGSFKTCQSSGKQIENQLSLFQYLYSLNFNIGFPENSTTDLI